MEFLLFFLARIFIFPVKDVTQFCFFHKNQIFVFFRWKKFIFQFFSNLSCRYLILLIFYFQFKHVAA